LYKNIEMGLEAQYQNTLMFSNSLSPPQAHLLAPSLNLSRSSPFGNLGQISSRRTYAYLIATLNASHPDYDFSHVLRPSDFKRERALRAVMNNLDTTLYNLRPRPSTPSSSAGGQTPSFASSGLTWGPRTWRLIDQQMRLKECTIYRYAPDDYDPFEEDEEGAIWSMNYFFFNKALKRVCYLYLRGISVLSQSPSQGLRTPVKSTKRFADDESDGWLTPDLGARKRARYWLGDRDDVEVAEHDEEDHDKDHDKDCGGLANEIPPPKRPLVDEHDNYILSDEDARSARSRSKSTVRGVSEDIAEAMEV
jgi:Maf1 regulator